MAISFHCKFELNYFSKMRGYPQFSFWILISPAIIVPHSHKPCKNIVVLVGKFLKKPEYPEIRRTYAQ